MPEKKVVIKQLDWEQANLDQILEIENSSFEKVDAFTLEDFEFWYSFNPDFCLVAEIDGRIVGDIFCRIQRYKLELASLAIHPDYRRSGIGSMLINEVATQARMFAIRKIGLEVRETNSSALAFWQKMGFSITGSQPNYYADGGTALQMIKDI